MKKNVEIKKIPSIMPTLAGGMIALILTFMFPMYKLSSYFFVIGIGVAATFIIKALKIFKDEEIEVEIPIHYASTEIEELVELGKKQIDVLILNERAIENSGVRNSINSIIQTSQLIVDKVSSTQKIETDVRKYFRYYLEEVVKMVDKYRKFEQHELQVENISISKEKIEMTLENAKEGFLKFYNSLYADDALDVNVDLKVFDNMLKQLD